MGARGQRRRKFLAQGALRPSGIDSVPTLQVLARDSLYTGAISTMANRGTCNDSWNRQM